MKISLQLNEEMAPLIVKLITIGLSGVSSTETHKRSHSSSKGSSKLPDAAKQSQLQNNQVKVKADTCVFLHTPMHARTHAQTPVCMEAYSLFLSSPRQGDMCCSSSAANELRAGTSPFENIHTQLHVTFQLLNAEMGYHFMMQYVFQGCDSTRR